MNRNIQKIVNWNFSKLKGISMAEVPVKFPNNYQTITVPHTWYLDDDYYRGVAVYETTISCLPNWNAYLEFQGADQWCKVYINQMFAGEHKGGYSTFRIPIKKDFIQNNKITIQVYLDNTNHGTINPSFGDFTIYGGLYRDVSLITVAENHFDMMYYGTQGLLIQTDVNDHVGQVNITPKVILNKNGHTPHIVYEIRDSTKTLVYAQTGCINEKTTLTIENVCLWDGLENASLYFLNARLICDDIEYDRVELPFGFRTIHLSPETGFYLNGKSLFLRGVAKHQDYDNCYCATTVKEQSHDIQLIREIGANAIRLSHYQHPQYTYDLCDKEGCIVWAEIPVLRLSMDTDLLENGIEQLKELILQNMHHPSICFWGIQNEIGMFGTEQYMFDYCKKLTTLAKELDSSRIIACANMNQVEIANPLNSITDAVGQNLYFGWYYGKMQDYKTYLDEFHSQNPNMPIGISEYGVDCNLHFHTETPTVRDYSEEFQALFHETVYPILESKTYLWGSFIWNMFDFGSAIRNEGDIKHKNCKGLVTYDRKIKKDAFYYYKARWSNEPFVHITGKRFQKRNAAQITIKIYSNLPQVTLLINGKQTLSKTPQQPGVFLFPDIDLITDGQTKIQAIAENCTDNAVFVYTDIPEESYIYHDTNKGQNVRNWFIKETSNND